MTARTAGSRCARRRSDRGAGTVLALMVIMVVVTAVWVAGALVAGVTARRSAAAAADLTALAVAEHVTRGVGDPCAVGDRVATVNGGRMVECTLIGVDVEVVVEVEVSDGPYAWVPHGSRRARAGPSPGA